MSCANDGESAVARYADALNCREPFDAVILDLTVRGGMGGAKAMERLVAIDPGVEGIVIGGYSDDPVMAEPERYGFRCAIAKPFRPDKLARALRRVVEASHETAVDHS